MTQPSAAAPSDGASPNAPGAGEGDRLRTTRLFLLAAGLFVFLTAEMYPVGAMPDMTRDLGESESAVGRLVTWYAIGVGVATIPVVMATRALSRRLVIVGSLLALFVSMALSAIAPNLLVVTIARLIGAIAHGGIFAVVPVAAASLARKGAEAKAVGGAFLGASVGVVAGPPFVAAVSEHVGWRFASGVIAVIALLVAMASQLKLPPLEARSGGAFSLRIPASMRVPFYTLCGVTALIVTAHNAAWAFIAPILEARGISGTAYAVELFCYGLAGALTTAFASRHLDAHPRRVTTIALTCMILALLALTFLPGTATGAVAAVVWGGAFGVLPVAMQTRVLTTTPGHNDAATPIYVVAFQIGISLGAYIGSVLILTMAATRLPLFAAVVTAFGLPLLAWGMRDRHGSEASTTRPE